MAPDPERPGLWTRLVARLGGEVPTATLEAYRRAGAAVYDLLSDVERRRAALSLPGTDPHDGGEAIHDRIEESVRRAIATAYLLGQLAAMPRLLDSQQDRPVPGRLRRKLPLPGEPGFDPWCLADPAVRSDWQRDPRARKAIELLWRHDPRPTRRCGSRRGSTPRWHAGRSPMPSTAMGDRSASTSAARGRLSMWRAGRSRSRGGACGPWSSSRSMSLTSRSSPAASSGGDPARPVRGCFERRILTVSAAWPGRTGAPQIGRLSTLTELGPTHPRRPEAAATPEPPVR
jgi:hypothetical protein